MYVAQRMPLDVINAQVHNGYVKIICYTAMHLLHAFMHYFLDLIMDEVPKRRKNGKLVD